MLSDTKGKFDAHQGLFQIGMVWGIGVSLAIYVTRHLSCAHLNPAVTLAMVTSGRMAAGKMPVYIIAQFMGAFMKIQTETCGCNRE